MSDQESPEKVLPFPNEEFVSADKKPQQDVHLATDFLEMAKKPQDIPCFSKSMGYGGLSAAFGGLISKYALKKSLVDGMFAGFLVGSVATWLVCRNRYESLRDQTHRLMVAQSRPADRKTLEQSIKEEQKLREQEKDTSSK